MTRLSLAGAVTAGTEGARLSTVKVLVLLTGEALVAASRLIALTECGPALRAAGCGQLKAPAAEATPTQTDAPSTLTVTLLLGSAVPL